MRSQSPETDRHEATLSLTRPFSSEERALFSLLAAAMFQVGLPLMPEGFDWKRVIEEARQQAVLPLVAEGMASLPPARQAPQELKQAAQQAAFYAVTAYERILHTQDQLIALFQRENIPCVILKGLGAAACYPKPELRLQGDIDLLVHRHDLDRACALLERTGYQENKRPQDKHIAFLGHGAEVELHYEAANYPGNPAGEAIHAHMSQVVDRAVQVALGPYRFPALKGLDQAVSLLMHMQRHIWAEGLGLRQLCDWTMFVHHLEEGRWEQEIAPALQSFGLYRFAQIVTGSCAKYLGLPEQACRWHRGIGADDLSHSLLIDLVSSGNFGRKDPDRQGYILIEGPENGKPIRVCPISRINAKARLHMPLCKRYPVFLPVAWVYLPVRYYLGRRKGKHMPIRLNPAAIAKAKIRTALYRQFHLFEP